MKNIVLIAGAVGYTNIRLASFLIDLSKIKFLNLEYQHIKPTVKVYHKLGERRKKTTLKSPHIHHRFRQGNRRRTNQKTTNFD